jgi:hypothetical protein
MANYARCNFALWDIFSGFHTSNHRTNATIFNIFILCFDILSSLLYIRTRMFFRKFWSASVCVLF